MCRKGSFCTSTCMHDSASWRVAAEGKVSDVCFDFKNLL